MEIKLINGATYKSKLMRTHIVGSKMKKKNGP